MATTSYVALGSNLGDRAGHLHSAIERLRHWPGVHVARVSRFWETTPVGGPPDQGPYLNAAVELETTLTPTELLAACLAIEQEHGRERQERHGPRTLDLDILLFGAQVLQTPELTVPHPRLHERAFMLGPLAELAPAAVHPVLGRTPIELLAELSELPLSGRCCLVTGSSSGIGRAIALALAERGADVLVHARQSRERAQEVVEMVRAKGRTSELHLADLRDSAACDELADWAWNYFRGLDVWINNAGADTLTGDNARLDFAAKLELLWQVDVRATIQLGRAIGRRMRERGWGVILNMGWDQAEIGMEGDSGELFAATKGAVMAFSKSLALSLAPAVRVNCLAPGWIRTAWGESASTAWQERAVREAPLRRWGTPEDVARVACWLASPDAEFLTGQTIRIDGGVVR
jgi:2-amino-4-hydroxy-6-hydroxymethyldihydropteridine diphosphokinase